MSDSIINDIVNGFDRPADDEADPEADVHVRFLNLSSAGNPDGSGSALGGEGLVMRSEGGRTEMADAVIDSFVAKGLVPAAGWIYGDRLSDDAMWWLNWLRTAKEFNPTSVTDPQRQREWYRRGGRCEVMGCGDRTPHFHGSAYARVMTKVINENTGYPYSMYLHPYDRTVGFDEQTTEAHYCLMDIDLSKRLAHVEGRSEPRDSTREEIAAAMVEAGNGLLLLHYELEPFDFGTVKGTNVRFPIMGIRQGEDTRNLVKYQKIGVVDHDRAVTAWDQVRDALVYLYKVRSGADLPEQGEHYRTTVADSF